MRSVTLIGQDQSQTSENIKSRITDFAKAAGMEGEIQKWGGMGRFAPFVSFSCSDAFAAAVEGAKDTTFKDLILNIVDPSAPQPPAHCDI